MSFCRKEGLHIAGSKKELSDRIIYYLDTGLKRTLEKPKSPRPNSKFDWNKEPLNDQTLITDNYKNTENVRRFFLEEIGTQFKFSVVFMNWIKANHGLTLGNAVSQWKFIREEANSKKGPKKIAPQFEYNRYLRDFLADNKSASRETGIKLWKIKKSLRGDNVYREEDLQFINNVDLIKK